MALPTLIVICGYIILRAAIRFSDFEKVNPVHKVRLYMLYLACGSFVVGSLFCAIDDMNYTPGEWMITPTWLFLGWLVIVVTDVLYQFPMLSSCHVVKGSQMSLEEKDIEVNL